MDREYSAQALTHETLESIFVAAATMQDSRGLPLYFRPEELIVRPNLRDLAREILGHRLGVSHEEDAETGEWIPLPRPNVVLGTLKIVVDSSRVPEGFDWIVMAAGDYNRVHLVSTDKGVIAWRMECVLD